MPRNQLVQSLQRGMHILTLVSESNNGLSLNEICSATGLRPPTAHNLVRTLTHEHFLARNGNPRYLLGPAVMEIAGQHRQRGFLKAVEAQVRALHREFAGSIVSFCELRSHDIHIAMRMWPQRPGVMERPATATMHPYTTVTSLVFQAFWPGDRLAVYRSRFPLWELGAHLWPAEEALDAELDGIRRRGYATALRNQTTLLVAAPVFGPGNDIVGAFGLRTDHVDGSHQDISPQQGVRLVEAARTVLEPVR